MNLSSSEKSLKMLLIYYFIKSIYLSLLYLNNNLKPEQERPSGRSLGIKVLLNFQEMLLMQLIESTLINHCSAHSLQLPSRVYQGGTIEIFIREKQTCGRFNFRMTLHLLSELSNNNEIRKTRERAQHSRKNHSAKSNFRLPSLKFSKISVYTILYSIPKM